MLITIWSNTHAKLLHSPADKLPAFPWYMKQWTAMKKGGVITHYTNGTLKRGMLSFIQAADDCSESILLFSIIRSKKKKVAYTGLLPLKITAGGRLFLIDTQYIDTSDGSVFFSVRVRDDFLNVLGREESVTIEVKGPEDVLGQLASTHDTFSLNGFSKIHKMTSKACEKMR